MFVEECVVLICLWQLSSCSLFQDLNGESQCQCVPSHLCGDNDEDDINYGHGLLDIRFDYDACPNYYEVCCDIPLKEEPKVEDVQKRCGVASLSGIGPRITSNSEIALFGELPWTVLVLRKDRKSDRNPFICGGSLIHPQVVITAGHCVLVTETVNIKIRAGEWNIRNTNEPLPHQDNSVTEILIHPQYKPGILWNDIALLFLTKPFTITDNIGFICLPPPKQSRSESEVADEGCIASGWGKSAFSKSSRHSSVLRKVTLPLISRPKCQTALRNTRLGKFYKLHKSFICAGGEKNKDTCKGDGGSPLICPVFGENGRFVQMGIVSWGIGCGGDKTPGVYVNVQFFTEWIDKQMELKNFSTSYYKL